MFVLQVQEQDRDIDWSDKHNTMKDKEKQFFIQNLPPPLTFSFISQTDWAKLRTKQKRDCSKDLQWTNIISGGIRKIHPHCSFVFFRTQGEGSGFHKGVTSF